MLFKLEENLFYTMLGVIDLTLVEQNTYMWTRHLHGDPIVFEYIIYKCNIFTLTEVCCQVVLYAFFFRVENITALHLSLWRNWLARSAVNREDDGSSPSRDE